MGYYMGDYYAGMRGGCGSGSFFKGIASLGASFIPGVGGGLSKMIERAGRPISMLGGGAAATGGRVVKAVGGAVMRHPIISAAGAAGIIGVAVGGKHLLSGGMCPKGHHISRKGKNAGACVRNRRMNPCNVHALRRASRRAHAFLRISRKLVGYYQPKKHKGHPFIKARKKSK